MNLITHSHSPQIGHFLSFHNFGKILQHLIGGSFHIEVKERLCFGIENGEAIVICVKIRVIASEDLHQIRPLHPVSNFDIHKHNPLHIVIPDHAVLAHILHDTVEHLGLFGMG
jgi:hypothetical protein